MLNESGSNRNTSLRSAPTLPRSSLAEQGADRPSLDVAEADHPVVDANPTLPAAHGAAVRVAAEDQSFERGLRLRAMRRMKLRSIEVGEPHLDPILGSSDRPTQRLSPSPT